MFIASMAADAPVLDTFTDMFGCISNLTFSFNKSIQLLISSGLARIVQRGGEESIKCKLKGFHSFD